MSTRRLLVGAVAIAALSTGLLAGSAQAAAAPALARSTVRACTAHPAKHHASCLAEVRTDTTARPFAAAAPKGYGPADIRSAYKLPGSGGGGRTVAIVDAQDDPTAEADLAKYRSTYGLPACTTANGCFRKVDQRGGTKYPAVDAGWALEISLDLDMVSATCPGCHILLVEADSASIPDLGAAVNRAATLKASAISNSYGGGDIPDLLFGSYYNHPGIAVTASTGDSGYQGGSFPADSRYVTAVGGTSLAKASNSRGWTETAWNGAGSGCSDYNAAVPAAKPFKTGCGSNRAIADVSAVADPATGVAVYDSTPYMGRSGWFVVGGTSASSPIVASVYALAGDLTSGYANRYPYQRSTHFFDVTAGNNGSCSPSQLCTARTGWDGPTGVGTPNGTAGL